MNGRFVWEISFRCVVYGPLGLPLCSLGVHCHFYPNKFGVASQRGVFFGKSGASSDGDGSALFYGAVLERRLPPNLGLMINDVETAPQN